MTFDHRELQKVFHNQNVENLAFINQNKSFFIIVYTI